jgi:type II secretory pathway pseudopilin PulG
MQQTERDGREQKCERGAALILTLVAIAIASLLAAAVATLVLSHNSRARTDQDALKALYAADAALNYQTQRIFATTDDPQIAYNGSTNVNAATYGLSAARIPVTGKAFTFGATSGTLSSFLNLTGSTDYCRCWIEYYSPFGNSTTPLNLASADPFYVYGEASVNGVMRRVRAKAGANGLFNNWAVFTNGTFDVGGSLTVTPLTGTSLGIVGSNTSIIAGGGQVGGQVIYGTGVPASGFPYTYGGRAVELPSADELAEAAYTAGGYATTTQTGISKFSANNDNLTLGTFSQGNSGTVAMPANGNPGSYPLKLSSKPQVTGQSLKEANFYLTRLDGSNVTIWADVSKGPINLWVSNTNNNNQANDSLQGSVDIVAYSAWDTANNRPLATLNDSKKFHIYYSNQNGSLKITGGGSTGNIFAMLYAYNVFNGVPAGAISVAGGVTVNGAAYSQSLSGTGNFQVNYPSNITVGDGGGILFGLSTPWQEVYPPGGN